MIYFTADTHFGHANIVKMCQRPYPDVDATMIEWRFIRREECRMVL